MSHGENVAFGFPCGRRDCTFSEVSFCVLEEVSNSRENTAMFARMRICVLENTAMFAGDYRRIFKKTDPRSRGYRRIFFF